MLLEMCITSSQTPITAIYTTNGGRSYYQRVLKIVLELTIIIITCATSTNTNNITDLSPNTTFNPQLSTSSSSSWNFHHFNPFFDQFTSSSFSSSSSLSSSAFISTSTPFLSPFPSPSPSSTPSSYSSSSSSTSFTDNESILLKSDIDEETISSANGKEKERMSEQTNILESELNATSGDGTSSELPKVLRTTAMITCIVILVFGVTGNILVPFVVCKTRELCTNSTNVFLINLSVADLLVLMVCMPTVLIELYTDPEKWILGAFLCKAVPFVELVVAHGSILTILAISFERYYAICMPLKASYKCTMRRAIITIGALWSIAILATIPVLFGTELSESEYIDGTVVPVCITKASTLWQKVYFFGSMILFFWIPLLILVGVYSVIAKRLVTDDRRLLIASTHSSMSASFVNLRSSLAAISTTGSMCEMKGSVLSRAWANSVRHGSASASCTNEQRSNSRAGSASALSSARMNVSAEKAQMRCRRQVVLMLGTVVICFFICLLPWRVFTLWVLFASDDDVQSLSMEGFYSILYFCRILLYMNSMLNPFLYAVVSSKFRTALVETLCQYCCYCEEYFCCLDDDLDDEFQKGNAPTGKARRRYRRNRRFLLRQSTFNTTTTTTTSLSVKTHSIHHYPQRTRFSSMDSIWTQHRLQQNCQNRPLMRLQHSLDIEISPISSPIPTEIGLESQFNTSNINGAPSTLAVSRLSPLKESPTPTFSPENEAQSKHPVIVPDSSSNVITLVNADCQNQSALPADIRRAILRRTSRVTVLDDDPTLVSCSPIACDSSPNSSVPPVSGSSASFDCSFSGSDSLNLPIIERILSDPQLSSHESFV